MIDRLGAFLIFITAFLPSHPHLFFHEHKYYFFFFSLFPTFVGHIHKPISISNDFTYTLCHCLLLPTRGILKFLSLRNYSVNLFLEF